MDNNAPSFLICRSKIQSMLGGISRTTFWRKRQEWDAQGTPFPKPDENYAPIRGGALYRYSEVMDFFKSKGYSTQDNM
ncbi:helix-turn-helix domain-containing protein [Morganella morganii]|uniref:helix-turn-helix domain-containing protein n=1 Tax=Morganella morganii TaxID=582 RepID=UPI0034E3F942